MGVDLCLRKGMPAAEMARELQKYLRHPDELYRRVRDQHGNLTLSKAAKDFHPGRGVYRSSYKNALRLAITETNMAYRLADWERWQQMDFVVGIRIQLSNNHTCLGKDGEPHPFHDICDELAGEYPKSFKWVGWHPQCRCNAVPILKTVDEKIADNMAKRNGGKASKESVNSVKRMPKAFNEWVERNRDRIAAAKSQPYFIRDNAVEVGKIIPGVLPEIMMPATPVIPIAERAQMRHDARTPEQIADIRRRWTLREAEIRHAARTPEQAEAIRSELLAILSGAKGDLNPKLIRMMIGNEFAEKYRIVEVSKTRISVETQAGIIYVNTNHGATEFYENLEIAIDRKLRHGYEIELCEKKEGKKCADSYNLTLKRYEEYKVNKKGSKGSIDRLIRDGSQQADVIVLRLDTEMSFDDLADGIHDRAVRCKSLKEIILILNGKEARYTRDRFKKKGFKIQPGDFE